MKYYEMDGGRICKTFKNDCVVRSISIAMKKPYKQVFTDLMNIGLELGAYPNYDKVWIKYLEDRGWVKNKPPRSASGRLIRLYDWAEAPSVAVIRNSRHLTCLVDNTICDTWDCRRRPVNSYWTPTSETCWENTYA